MDFTKKSVRIGTITTILAIVANFLPAIYVSIAYDAMPELSVLLALWGILAATYFFSWVVQPISFFPALGTAGTYMSFVAGSIGDIRIPAITMAQKASGTEAATPKGDVMAVIGVAASVVVSFLMVTLFTFIGQAIIPLFPKFVNDSFTYHAARLVRGRLHQHGAEGQALRREHHHSGYRLLRHSQACGHPLRHNTPALRHSRRPGRPRYI